VADINNGSGETRTAGEDLLSDDQTRRAVDFLRKHLADYIAKYHAKRNNIRAAANITKLVTIIFWAMTTISLGLKSYAGAGMWEERLPAFALITSTLVTALATWEGFADYRWRWIRYRATLYALYNIRDDLEFQLSGTGVRSVADVDNFYNRIKLTLKETNEQWVSQRMKGTGAGNAEPEQAAAGQT
jgi:hypothetical protein